MNIIYNAAIEIMNEAATLGQKLATRPIEQMIKADGSPVTTADLALNSFLKQRLLALPLPANWLSEEEEKPAFIHAPTWIIDPIDGTRGFIKGSDEWTISVALVVNNRPLLAFLARPMTQDLYVAQQGQGAFLNKTALKMTPVHRIKKARLSGPHPYIKKFEALGAVLTPRIHSLALRLAYVAQNRLEAVFVSSSAHDWDIAASDLIITEAGGVLLNTHKMKPLYGQGAFKHGELIGAHQTLFDLL